MFLAASAAAGFAAARLLRAGKAARDHEWTNSGSPRESYGGAQTGYSGAGSSMTGVTGVGREYDPSAGIDRKSTRLTPVTNAQLVCRLMLEQNKYPNS